MALWHFVGEPTLDELIEDEMMIPVMRSAGIDAVRLRAAYVEMARRRRGDTAPRPTTASLSRSCEAALCF